MRVIDVIARVEVLRREPRRCQEEHVAARFARVQERRQFGGRPRGDQADTTRAFYHPPAFNLNRPRGLEDLTSALHRARAGMFGFRHSFWLILIHIPRAVDVLRHERVVALEEQAAAVREIARLVEFSRPSWDERREPGFGSAFPGSIAAEELFFLLV